MKKTDKKLLLASLENQTENHLQLVIATFQNMSSAKLLEPSPTAGWSIAQCLEHLNSYGRYYLPAIKKELDKAPSDSSFFTSSWLGAYFVRIMDPKTSKKKYKAFKDHVPAPDLDAHRVVAEFIEQQEILLSYLRQAHSIDLTHRRVSISIAKWLKLRLGNVFQFIIAHNERHLKQALRSV